MVRSEVNNDNNNDKSKCLSRQSFADDADDSVSDLGSEPMASHQVSPVVRVTELVGYNFPHGQRPRNRLLF